MTDRFFGDRPKGFFGSPVDEGFFDYVDKLNKQKLAQIEEARSRDRSQQIANRFYDHYVGGALDQLYGLEAMIDGRIDPTSQEGIGRVFDLAAMTAGGGIGSQAATKAGRAGLRDPNTVRMFAGPKAKTADLSALESAKDMIARGAKREDVLKETGWFQDVDRKWRFEISDDSAAMDMIDAASEMKASPDFNWKSDTVPLAGVLEHDDLFKAYPELADVQVRMMPEDFASSHGVRGSISSDGKLALKDRETDPGIALHEVQHAIQEIEGFDPGMNPKRAQGAYLKDLGRQAEFHKKTVGEVFERNPEVAQKFRLYKQAMIQKNFDEMDRIEAELMSHPDGVELVDADFQLGMLSDAMAKNEFDPVDIYRRSAGEVEARNVESRRSMSPNDRRARAPWKTQDRGNYEKITGY